MNDNKEGDYVILVRNLSKLYPSSYGSPPKFALEDITLGIKKNTCFGILGHNGAGKTTLLNLLSGLFPPTAGTAKLCGFDLRNDLDKIHTIIGICPQFDILWETLTAEEHLLFFGRLRNLEKERLQMEVDSLLKRVNLYDVRKILAKNYSGGMKRRLSVAIAMIGHPPIILLDEPSTGLDPKSRQDLWQVIHEAKRTSTMILTTHSMEEADVICDRLMIMIDGRLKCFGVSADLKSRFGEGYKLSIQTAKYYDDPELVEAFVQRILPNSILVNHLSSTRNYQVPKEIVALDRVFEAIENERERLHITDWAITNTTLEEVFLHISKDRIKGQEFNVDSNDGVRVRKKNRWLSLWRKKAITIDDNLVQLP